MEHPLDGWDIGRFDEVDWMPWGAGGKARAKLLASADGYNVALIEAEPGYEGFEHEHVHPEFQYVVEGTLRTQGRVLKAGDAYAAAAGSRHTDFVTETGATYFLVFKL